MQQQTNVLPKLVARYDIYVEDLGYIARAGETLNVVRPSQCGFFINVEGWDYLFSVSANEVKESPLCPT